MLRAASSSRPSAAARHCLPTSLLAALLPVPSKPTKSRSVIGWRVSSSNSSSSSSSSSASRSGMRTGVTRVSATNVARAAAPGNGVIGTKVAGTCCWPMITLPEPPITTPPWLAVLPWTTAGRPLISTLGMTWPLSAAPQEQASPWRAAGRPSNSTSAEPAAMADCPQRGQVTASVTRAAGLPDI
ncbi:hypothetical protein FQZ97_1042660 [compost metagenome]